MSPPLVTTVPTLSQFNEQLRDAITEFLRFNQEMAGGCRWRLITRGQETLLELHEGSIAGGYREISIVVEDVTEAS